MEERFIFDALKALRTASFQRAVRELDDLRNDPTARLMATWACDGIRQAGIAQRAMNAFKLGEAWDMVKNLDPSLTLDQLKEQAIAFREQMPGFPERAEAYEIESDALRSQIDNDLDSLGERVRKFYPALATFWTGPVPTKRTDTLDFRQLDALGDMGCVDLGGETLTDIARGQQQQILGTVAALCLDAGLDPLARNRQDNFVLLALSPPRELEQRRAWLQKNPDRQTEEACEEYYRDCAAFRELCKEVDTVRQSRVTQWNSFAKLYEGKQLQRSMAQWGIGLAPGHNLGLA